MIGKRRAWRSLDDALAVVSPLAFADSVEAFLTGLPPDELRPLVLRSIKRMSPSDRAQFALFLGHDAANAYIDEVGGPAIPARELQTLVESCDDLLPNRFAAFLRENPRAVGAMGGEAHEAIFKSLEERGAAPEDGFERDGRHRVPAGVAALAGLTIIVAVVPLVAQYAHQRGMLSGLSEIASVPQIAAPQHPAPRAQRPTAQHRIVSANLPGKPHMRHVVAHAPVKPTPPRKHANARVRQFASTPVTHHAQVRHVAAAWKFDPQWNPYLSHNWRKGYPHTPVIAYSRARPHRSSAFEDRAQLAVSSYLNAVIAGDTPSALRHLGLPPDASSSNISETPIVSRDARARIVGTKVMADGKTSVQVQIAGRRGEYFEVFEVAHDGPAVRIADRYYIPVNRTAEELSARLLAKITH